jgi:putative methionine-R-sulfoxide reductase with GAF domain
MTHATHFSVCSLQPCTFKLSIEPHVSKWQKKKKKMLQYRDQPRSDGTFVLGPFMGRPACLRIGLSKGVIGACADSGKVLIVPDVAAFPGHISCDSASRAEMCAPVYDAAGDLVAVLDVDSTEIGFFDERDADLWGRIAREIGESSAWPAVHPK